MTDRVQEIRDRLEAATPGPWSYSPASTGNPSDGPTHHEVRSVSISDDRTMYAIATTDYNEMGYLDAEFIAHAPDDIEFLLAEVERLQEDLEVTRDSLGDLAGSLEYLVGRDRERFYGD